MKQLFSIILSLQLICAPLLYSNRAGANEIQTNAEVEQKKREANQASHNAVVQEQKGNQVRNQAAQLELNRKQKEASDAQKSLNAAQRELNLKERELEQARHNYDDSYSRRDVERLQQEVAEAKTKVEERSQTLKEKQAEVSKARDYAQTMSAGRYEVTAVQVTDADQEKYNKEVGSVDAGENAEYDNKSQSAGGFGRYKKQLLGMATSIVGSSIIEQCSFGMKIPSIATYMAGSITYLISEITGGQNQNTEQEERLARIQEIKQQIAANKGGGDVQRVLLEQRLKEEEDLSEFVSERITWLTAVGVMYTVAAGLAIMEETQGIAAGVVAANTQCSMVAAQQCSGTGPGYPACYAAAYAGCVVVSPTGHLAANGASASPASVETGTTAATSTGPFAPGALGYLTSYLAGAYAGCTPISAGNVAMGPFSANLISVAYGMGLSMGENSMVGYVALATSVLNFLIPGLKQLVVAAYNYPIPRAITFGISAGLVFSIVADLNQIKAQTDGNVEQLSKVVNDFKLATTDENGMKQGAGRTEKDSDEMNGGAGEALASSSPKSLAVGNNANVSKLSGLEVKTKDKQCFSNEKGNLSFDTASCSKPAKIKPVVVKVQGTNQSTLKTAAGLINEIANDLSSGDRASANVKMGQLNAMASSIKSEVDKLKTGYNNQLKKDKKAPFDFDKAVAEGMKKYDDLFEQGREKAMQEDPKLASVDSSLPNSRAKSGLSALQSDEVKQDIKESSADEAIVLKSAGDLNAAALAAESMISEGFYDNTTHHLEENDLLYGGDKTSNNPFGLNEDAFRAASANGYLHLHGRKGYGAAEGVAAQKENLFKIISNRYFLSYPKVMNRKIAETPTTE